MSIPRMRWTKEGAARLAFALLLWGAVAVPLLPAAAHASPIVGVLDYQGFAFESLSVGTPGSVLTGVGTVDTWFLPLNDPLNFYTWKMTDLVGQGAVPLGGGASTIQYAGGTFQIFQDLVDNSDYDVTPGNGQPDPFGFDDGTPWLIGEFTTFDYFWHPASGLGAYSGEIFITGGVGSSYFPEDIAFTFGGTTDQSFLPESYSIKVDGAMEGPMVPEPASVLLVGMPLAGWVAARCRRTVRRGRVGA